jgi:hypothetical protein
VPYAGQARAGVRALLLAAIQKQGVTIAPTHRPVITPPTRSRKDWRGPAGCWANHISSRFSAASREKRAL